MKHKLFKHATLMFGVLALFLASCATTNKSVTAVPMAPSSSLDIMKADYVVDVNAPLKGSSKSTWVLGVIKIAGDATYADGMAYSSSFGKGKEGFARLFGWFAGLKITQAKAAAAYRAVEGTGADFIANPQYKITQTKTLLGLIKSYDAEVTGYKGKYTKIYQSKSGN